MARILEATRVVNGLRRAGVLDELRRIAEDLGRAVESRDLTEATWRAVRRHFGTMVAARRAAGLPDPRRNTRWSETLVLDEIRRLSRAGVVITQHELNKRSRSDLVGAISKYVGSIVRARRLARVPDPPPRLGTRERWDEDRVMAEIRARHRDGEPLARSKTPTRLVKAGMRYYGSWQAAIEVAGLDYDRIRQVRVPYTKRELLDLLRALHVANPGMTRAQLYKLPYHPALVERFGSIDAALQRAGLHGWPRRIRDRAMSREDVARALRGRHRAGQPTNWQTVQREHFHLWYSALLHHGEWARALEAAALPNDPMTNEWTRETILMALRERLAQGKSLKPADMLREASELYYSVRSYFTSYLAAVREVGDAPWALTRWTPKRIVAALRRKAGRARRITARIAGVSLVATSQYHFGSFSAACRAAGLLTGRARPRSTN